MSRFSIDMVGKTLEQRFRVTSALTRGGMASVYEGHDTKLNQPVVIKVPLPEVLLMDGFRERFHAEVTDLVNLRHPHIVRVLSQGEDDDVPYLVLEMLSGGSLSDRIRGAVDGRLEYESLASWLPDVAATLDFIHQREVVHRDVKPGNILFDTHGHAFLSDFGIAKAVGRTKVSQTSTGVPLGSPPYMAPEQGGGNGALNGRADQYGLASTIYHALSGELPFSGDTPLQVVVQKQIQDAPPLAEVTNGAVPDDVSEAVARGLAKEPAERFKNCRALSDAVLRRDTSHTERTRRVPQAKTKAAPGGSKRRAGLAVLAIAVLAAAGGAFFLMGERGEQSSASPSSPRGDVGALPDVPATPAATRDPTPAAPAPQPEKPAAPSKEDLEAKRAAQEAEAERLLERERLRKEREAKEAGAAERLRLEQVAKEAQQKATAARGAMETAKAGWRSVYAAAVEIPEPALVATAADHAKQGGGHYEASRWNEAKAAFEQAGRAYEASTASYRKTLGTRIRAALVRADLLWKGLVEARGALKAKVGPLTKEADKQQDLLDAALAAAEAADTMPPDEYGILLRARGAVHRARAKLRFFASDVWNDLESLDPGAESEALGAIAATDASAALHEKASTLQQRLSALRAALKRWTDNAEASFAIDDEGRTRLHGAVLGKDAKAVKSLLAAGLDPNLADEDGLSALHHAAWSGNPEIASLLLEAGGRPDTRAWLSPVDEEPLGFSHGALLRPSVLHLAAYKGNDSVATLLVEHGADLESLVEFKSMPKGG